MNADNCERNVWFFKIHFLHNFMTNSDDIMRWFVRLEIMFMLLSLQTSGLSRFFFIIGQFFSVFIITWIDVCQINENGPIIIEICANNKIKSKSLVNKLNKEINICFWKLELMKKLWLFLFIYIRKIHSDSNCGWMIQKHETK